VPRFWPMLPEEEMRRVPRFWPMLPEVGISGLSRLSASLNYKDLSRSDLGCPI